MTYLPECGNMEPHHWHEHSWMDEHFKEHFVWCGGLCGCGCTCAEHMGQEHGPGDHK